MRVSVSAATDARSQTAVGSPAFHAILAELAELHNAKDAEYSGEEPLSNYRTAEEWGDPAWKSSLLRAEEKRKRLQNQWNSGKELRRDDFIDLIAHWCNTLVLWSEMQQEELGSLCTTGNLRHWPHPSSPCYTGYHDATGKCGWACRVCGFVCR